MSFRGRSNNNSGNKPHRGGRGGGGGGGGGNRGGRFGGASHPRGGRGGGGRGRGRGGQRHGGGGQKRDRREYEQEEDDNDDDEQQDEEDYGEEDGDDDDARPSSMSSKYSLARALHAHASDAEDGEEDGSEGPSEYEQLLSALRGDSSKTTTASTSLTAKHRDMLKKRQREEQGREEEPPSDDDEEAEEENEDQEEDGEEMDGIEGEESDEDAEGEDEEMEDGEDEDDEEMEEGEADENEDDDDDEDGSSAKRRKLHADDDGADEDGADDDGEDDEEEDEMHGDGGHISGDDALSDEENASENDDEASLKVSADAAAELTDPDIFHRKFSHAHVFTPSQLNILTSAPNEYAKSHPWTKIAGGIPGVQEMIFVAGDDATVTLQTTQADGEKGSSSSSSTPSNSPLVLPPFLTPTPPSTIATSNFHLPSKIQECWLREIVEPERRKMKKKAIKDEKDMKGAGTGDEKKKQQQQMMKRNEERIEEEEEQEDEHERANGDDGASSSSSSRLLPSTPLTPATRKYCSSSCLCFLCSDFYSPLQSSTLGFLTSYRDLVMTHATPRVSKTIHEAVAVHIVSHLTKTREKVLKHTQVLTKFEEKERQRKEADRMAKKAWRDQLAAAKKLKKPPPPQPEASTPVDIPEYRDQGFTRPKVLCLFPTAKVAHEFVVKLLKLLPPKCKSIQQKRKRFDTDFATTPDDRCHPERPYEYKYYFDGKDSDAFRCGISFGQKAVKFYSPFYNADLIVASPLGLRMITGSVGDKITDREFDFLSSIEILFIDSFDVATSMQNAQHLQTVMEVLNLTPYDTKHSDFGRIREWNLSGHGKYNRQTILLADHPSLDLQNFQKLWLRNSEGKVQYRLPYTGVLQRVIPQVKQIFQRLHCDRLIDLPDARFDYFTTVVLPQLKSSYPDGHILVYVPSYFDYVRLRNYAKAKHLSVTYASEYTKNSHLSRGRSGFFHGEIKFMLLTERFHFFKRYAIRGVVHLVFYGLPTYEQFYVDFVNLLPSSNTSGSTGTVMALYSKFDSLELERIIGTQRATKLMQATNHTHMFC